MTMMKKQKKKKKLSPNFLPVDKKTVKETNWCEKGWIIVMPHYLLDIWRVDGWKINNRQSIDPSEATVTNYTDNVKIYKFRNWLLPFVEEAGDSRYYLKGRRPPSYHIKLLLFILFHVKIAIFLEINRGWESFSNPATSSRFLASHLYNFLFAFLITFYIILKSIHFFSFFFIYWRDYKNK